MKFEKSEKIILGVIGILIIWAGFSVIKENNLPKYTQPIFINTTEEKVLPQNIRELSKKFGAYEDLYSSDTPTFVYSYTEWENPLGLNKKFHKELSEKLKEANLNYKYIVYKNWEDDTFDITLKNRQYLSQSESCGPAEGEEKELEDFISLSQNCIQNACLLDVKNKKMTIISVDPDYIVEILKERNPQKI